MDRKLITLLFFANNSTLHCMEDPAATAWQPKSLITQAILAGEISLVESQQVHKLLGSPSDAWKEETYRLLFTHKNGRTLRSDFMNIAAWDCKLDPKAESKDTPETQECFDALEGFGDDVYESAITPEEFELPWLKERGFWGGVTFFREFKAHKDEIVARLEQKAKEQSTPIDGEK